MKHQFLIDKYFEGALSEQEQVLFQQLLAEDPEFQREVGFQKELKDVIGHRERSQVKKQLQRFESDQKKPERRRWLIAAVITILVLLSGVWYAREQNQDPEALFSMYYEPYRNVVYPIERNGALSEPKAQAFFAYEQGNYERALNAFSNLVNEDRDPVVDFYLANTYLSLDQPDAAIDLLKANLNEIDSLRDKHYWYLALAHLRTGNNVEAISRLEDLLNLSETSFKQKEARQILEKLK